MGSIRGAVVLASTVIKLWVLVKYHLFLIIMGVLYLNKTNNVILIKRLFQQFQNFTFENISLCLGKHFDD